MNLWVKRVALGLMAAVALFLFACLDEENVLGFKNQNKKFQLSYKEIEVKSSVLLFDRLRTSNYVSDQVRRLLVGRYTDPVFGVIDAEAYTQIVPSNTTLTKETGAIYDSVTLQLHYDLYQYGPSNSYLEEYTIYELTKDLSFANENDYYAETIVERSETPMGIGLQYVSPILFEEELEDTQTSDTVITVNIRLNKDLDENANLEDSFGERLFKTWDPSNPSFTDFEQFSDAFKGLAIVGTDNEHVTGFSVGSNSKLILHYHTADTDSLTYNFNIANVIAASKITVDRSTSELGGLTQPYVEFVPVNPDKRYIQSGSPVVVKLDFTEFKEFSESIDNLIINSAELSIDQIDEPGAFAPPNSLFVQLLNDGDSLKQLASNDDDSLQRVQDVKDIGLYNSGAFTLSDGSNGLLSSSVNKPSVFSVVSDTQQQLAQLTYNSEDKKYKGYINLFLQELALAEEGKTSFTNLVLYPGNPNASKSLNRVSFNKNSIKLKIYYTTPILTP